MVVGKKVKEVFHLRDEPRKSLEIGWFYLTVACFYQADVTYLKKRKITSVFY